MIPMQVGEAFVEIDGDYREIADNGARKIEKAFDKVAADLDLENMEEAFGKAGDKAGERFVRDANGRLRNSKGHFVREGAAAGRAIGQGVRRGVDQESRRDGGGGLLGRLFGGINNKLDSAGNALTKKLRDLLNPAKLAKLAGTGIVELISKTFTFGGIAGVIFNLTSSLLSLSGVLLTLPGILGSVALAGGTLAIAFSGFGDVIEALASGDIDKINESLKKLPPSARAVAREIGTIIPVLRDIRTQVQQNFFEQFEGKLTNVTKNLGGTFGKGFSNLATNLGAQLGTVLNRLSSPGARRFFERLFATANNFVTNVGPPLTRVFDAVAGAIERSLPFVDRFSAGLGGGLDRFAAFIDEKVADGSFDRFLENAFTTAGLLGDAIGEVVGLLQAMFEDSNTTGNEFLETFTSAIRELKEYFESEPGKEALETLVFLGKLMAGVVMTLIRATLGWLTAINKVYQAARNVYQTFKAAFGLYNEMTNAGNAIGSAFAAGARRLPGFAVGGIVDRPTVAHVGEAGPEAIVPLNNPRRAAEVMEDAGLLSIAAGMGSADSPTVIVYLGTEQITDILDTRVDKGLKRAGRALNQGVRT